MLDISISSNSKRILAWILVSKLQYLFKDFRFPFQDFWVTLFTRYTWFKIGNFIFCRETRIDDSRIAEIKIEKERLRKEMRMEY